MSTDELSKPFTQSKAAKHYAEMGIHTTGDLLRHYPRRYTRYGELTSIESLPVGEPVSVFAQVESATPLLMRDGRRRMLKVVVTDRTAKLEIMFFNSRPWHVDKLKPGKQVLFTGTVERFKGRRQLMHPTLHEVEEDEAGKVADGLVPQYPATKNLASKSIAKTIGTVLETLGDVEDPIPAEIRARHKLIGLRQAFEWIHRPADDAQWKTAQRRLRFEEAFILQAALARRRWTHASLLADPRLHTPGGLLEAFDERLPFELTGGQRVIGQEIANDLAAIHPMHRLLQGEVGSGKTVVALRAMLTVVDAGGQAALLAPTEVLALQHHRSITALLGDLAAAGQLGGDERGTRVVLLTGSTPASVRRKALLDLACGDAGIAVGTHALLSEQVAFFDLGLVVVDEQHRFGVEQRDVLRGKGRTAPHLLVMTATPIPRTVAMTVFGDLEISTLEELPAGRAPITTHVVAQPHWLERGWRRLREEVDAGRQCYVVCPRIQPEDDEPPLDPTLGHVLWRPPIPAKTNPVSAKSPAKAASKRPTGADPEEVLGQGELDVDGTGPQLRVPPVALVDVLEFVKAHPVLAGARIAALHGKMPAEERDAVMRAFTAGDVDILVATTVVEVGVDVSNATAMLIMDADRFGISQLHQLRGRVGRGAHPGICLLVTRAPDGTPTRARLDAVASTQDGFELARVDLEARREGDILGAAQSGSRSSLRLLRVLRDEKLIVTARHEASAVIAADPDLVANRALAVAIQELVDAEQEAFLDRS